MTQIRGFLSEYGYTADIMMTKIAKNQDGHLKFTIAAGDTLFDRLNQGMNLFQAVK